MRTRTFLVVLAAACLASSGASVAQDPKPGCASAAPAPAATPPAQGTSSGTAPGGMGSTAWSGGTGGSYIGTTPKGPTEASPSAQPPTASGLDPTKPSGGNSPAAC